MKINIGGGLKRFEGFVNVDADPNTKPEYLHNLETEKLPFEEIGRASCRERVFDDV